MIDLMSYDDLEDLIEKHIKSVKMEPSRPAGNETPQWIINKEILIDLLMAVKLMRGGGQVAVMKTFEQMKAGIKGYRGYLAKELVGKGEKTPYQQVGIDVLGIVLDLIRAVEVLNVQVQVMEAKAPEQKATKPDPWDKEG